MDDLISRKAMRKAMYHEAMEKDSDEQKWNGGCWIRYKMFERVIGSLPSAQKTGHWIPWKAYYGKDRKSWSDELKCSECGYKWGDKEYKFCPNCGARMVGEKE